MFTGKKGNCKSGKGGDMKTYSIYWTNLDGTEVKFYPVGKELPFTTMTESMEYIETSLKRLNLSNRFFIRENNLG